MLSEKYGFDQTLSGGVTFGLFPAADLRDRKESGMPLHPRSPAQDSAWLGKKGTKGTTDDNGNNIFARGLEKRARRTHRQNDKTYG